MDLEDKYYTPTTNEFYEEFEFEYFCEEGSLLSKDTTICTFKKQLFDSEWANIMFDEYEHEDLDYLKTHYRVKYLDKEDIESLGFTKFNYIYNYEKNLQAEESKDYSHWYKEFDCTSSKNTKVKIVLNIQTQLDIPYIAIWWHNDPEEAAWINKYNNLPVLSDYLFRGHVKNKLELKKLLKQLGINE